MTLTDIATLIGEIGLIIGTITPVMVRIRKITNGQKCQLRSDMLKIYYHNCEEKLLGSMNLKISFSYMKHIKL